MKTLLLMGLLLSGSNSLFMKLGGTNENKLIAQIKKENIETGYWPSDVTVRLEAPKDEGSDAEYCVRAVGSYTGPAFLEVNGTMFFDPNARLGRATEGCFSLEELESFGIQLPEQKIII